MSGGGAWFGPTTNSRHIYNKNNTAVAGGLPIATNTEYNFNVHPYATPDLVKTPVDKSVRIEVLKNDFDKNGDVIRISTFDNITSKNSSVILENGDLIYTPSSGFKGRDQFNYVISDGKLFNTTRVQVDVSDGGLEMRYDFEVGGTIVFDQSGAQLNGVAANFNGNTGLGINKSNGWVFPNILNTSSKEDNIKAFISFGDVSDLFDKSHSVSVWFKLDQSSLSIPLNCHIVSNSSTAINKLHSGYNIYADGKTNEIVFEVAEQLTQADSSSDAKTLKVKGNVIVADAWYHVILVIDRENLEVRGYLNGSQVGSAEALRPNGMIKGKPEGDRYTSGALGICTYKPQKYALFIGTMDEFRIYGKALKQGEIDDLYLNDEPISNFASDK